jgi:hypothetical protein
MNEEPRRRRFPDRSHLKGFPEAINAVFPQTVVETRIAHLIRHSLEFVSWKDRKSVLPALRAIYRAKDAEAGMKALEDFEANYWGAAISRRSRKAGGTTGSTSSHSLPIPKACGGSSTPRTP